MLSLQKLEGAAMSSLVPQRPCIAAGGSLVVALMIVVCMAWTPGAQSSSLLAQVPTVSRISVLGQSRTKALRVPSQQLPRDVRANVRWGGKGDAEKAEKPEKHVHFKDPIAEDFGDTKVETVATAPAPVWTMSGKDAIRGTEMVQQHTTQPIAPTPSNGLPGFPVWAVVVLVGAGIIFALRVVFMQVLQFVINTLKQLYEDVSDRITRRKEADSTTPLMTPMDVLGTSYDEGKKSIDDGYDSGSFTKVSMQDEEKNLTSLNEHQLPTHTPEDFPQTLAEVKEAERLQTPLVEPSVEPSEDVKPKKEHKFEDVQEADWIEAKNKHNNLSPKEASRMQLSAEETEALEKIKNSDFLSDILLASAPPEPEPPMDPRRQEELRRQQQMQQQQEEEKIEWNDHPPPEEEEEEEVIEVVAEQEVEPYDGSGWGDEDLAPDHPEGGFDGEEGGSAGVFMNTTGETTVTMDTLEKATQVAKEITLTKEEKETSSNMMEYFVANPTANEEATKVVAQEALASQADDEPEREEEDDVVMTGMEEEEEDALDQIDAEKDAEEEKKRQLLEFFANVAKAKQEADLAQAAKQEAEMKKTEERELLPDGDLD